MPVALAFLIGLEPRVAKTCTAKTVKLITPSLVDIGKRLFYAILLQRK